MDKTQNFEVTNPFFWADLVGTARYIINSTAPEDSCYMSETSIDLFKKIAELKPVQLAYISSALRKHEQDEALYLLGAKGAQAAL